SSTVVASRQGVLGECACDATLTAITLPSAHARSDSDTHRRLLNAGTNRIESVAARPWRHDLRTGCRLLPQRHRDAGTPATETLRLLPQRRRDPLRAELHATGRA